MSKYICIVKTSETFLKYHVNNLLTFTLFLDRKFPTWKFFNVYDSVTRSQVGNFTINNKPTKKIYEQKITGLLFNPLTMNKLHFYSFSKPKYICISI